MGHLCLQDVDILPDLSGSCIPVHHGHITVHEDQRDATTFAAIIVINYLFECLLSVSSLNDSLINSDPKNVLEDS